MQLQTWDRLQAVGRLLSIGAACLALAGLGKTALAQDEPAPSLNDPVVVVTNNKSTTQIVERFTKIAKLPGRIVRVDGFDPAVINVTAASPTEFRIMGIAPGVTTIVFADENGEIYTLEVFVAGDVRHLQAYIDRLFPGSAVRAVAVKDSVVLRGWVTRPENITAIVEIAEQFYPRVLNQMQVGGAQQVILKVQVMEVQRSKIRQLGFNFLFMDNNQFASNTVGQLTQVGDLPSAFGGSGQVISQKTLSAAQVAAGIVNNSKLFQGFLEALKQENLLKILAQPVLNTSNGRPAYMLAGGKFPILITSGLGNIRTQYKPFGVQLEAIPTILGNGRVRLELAPEVSERDLTTSVTLNGVTAPGLTTRQVNTQVEMEFGQTYMLAGLLSLRRVASMNKVPLFGELPGVFGSLFRRIKYDEAETELVILVTPDLAGPLEACQVPPGGPGMFTSVPTDTEFYCDGMIEVPSYGGRCNGVCDFGGLPGTQLDYAGPCQGGCQPGMEMMNFPMDSGSMGTGHTLVPGAEPMPAAPIPAAPPAAPGEAAPMIPELPLPGAGNGAVLPAPSANESSEVTPISYKQWYQYKPRSRSPEGAGSKSPAERPGLIAP